MVIVLILSMVTNLRGEVDILKFPTLPSLAFAIYRSHYLKDIQIPITKGKVFDFIQQSFTGGSTEMYIPYVPENEEVFCYDINSLYPRVMLANKYPIGNIIKKLLNWMR